MRRPWLLGVCVAMVLVSACSAQDTADRKPTPQGAAPPGSATVPAYAHIVLVMEENHGYHQIIGNPAAPFENGLAHSGVNFTQATAHFHPSQPNYLEFFSGATHRITDDHCITDRLTQPSLGGQLLHAGKTFTGYADGLPAPGATTCQSGNYYRYHNVPLAFADIPTSHVVPASQLPSGGYARLPALAWVTPNYAHDMHNGTVAAGDSWLRDHLGGYPRWARTHNSLLMVVFDENDQDNSVPADENHIPVILAGAHLKPGDNKTAITHDTLLALIEDSFGLHRLGAAIPQKVPPIFATGNP